MSYFVRSSRIMGRDHRHINFTVQERYDNIYLSPVSLLMKKGRLRWFRHAECKQDVDWVNHYTAGGTSQKAGICLSSASKQTISIALYNAQLITKALRYDSCVARGSHSFTCHPHMNHICLYSPAVRHHRP